MELQAVTIDAFGTLVSLREPVPALRAALAAHGVERDEAVVQRGFEAEVAYYLPRAHEGRDEAALALLRRDCAAVFLQSVGAPLDPGEFAAPFVDALRFELIPGAREARRTLSLAGLRVCVVSNWDVGLHEQLARLGLDLPVVTSAEAGAAKPDPAVFRLALSRLGVDDPARAVHVGDSPADARGAEAAGLRFEPAPLDAAVRRILA